MTADPSTPFRYMACVGTEAFDWSDSLDELLARLRRDADPSVGSDVAVWATLPCPQLLAVVRPWGEVVPLAARGLAG